MLEPAWFNTSVNMLPVAKARRIASPSASVPRWSKDIQSFRSSLKLSQFEFGKRLNCSAMAVSRWERGELAPSAASYLAMAKIAGPSFGWVFWNLAGITEDDVERMPTPKARTKKEHRDFSAAITILANEVARSEARATRRDALFQDIPTQAQRRECKLSARTLEGVSTRSEVLPVRPANFRVGRDRVAPLL
jgi:DNA-binding transcriptional regulator YiaG